jgi:hypothetical protein
MNMILRFAKITKSSKITDKWTEGINHDYRYSISPKKRLEHPDLHFSPFPYQQVFQERHGYIPNLSIIDLLFNEGPQALQILTNSLRFI